MRRRTWVSIALVAGLVSFWADPASAVQPTVQSFHSEGSNVPIEDCGSFVVLLTYTHDETIVTYYDDSGEAIRAQIRFRFSATLRNSVTGKKAYESGSFTIIADLLSDQARTVGLVLQIRSPRGGVALLELGHVTVDASGSWADSGPAKVLQGDSLLCSILA
jgi:hypothetical protein